LDPSLSVKTLRLANSSFYGLAAKVASIAQALRVLGLLNVQGLVMTCAAINAFDVSHAAELDTDEFLERSLSTACVARLLAPRAHVETGLAFTTAMLHDIGQLALSATYPDSYRDVVRLHEKDGISRIEAERRVIGVDHSQVGMQILRHWHFPEPICSAVGAHHDTDAGQGGALAGLIVSAEAVASRLIEGRPEAEIARALTECGLDAGCAAIEAERLKSSLTELAKIILK
jgi:putative nucleotidyltransferase with HDIG domain